MEGQITSLGEAVWGGEEGFINKPGNSHKQDA